MTEKTEKNYNKRLISESIFINKKTKCARGHKIFRSITLRSIKKLDISVFYFFNLLYKL